MIIVVTVAIAVMAIRVLPYNIANVQLMKAMLSHHRLSDAEAARLRSAFESAARRSIGGGGSYLHRAFVGRLHGNDADVLPDMKRAVEHAGSNPVPAFFLGQELLRRGDRDAAIAAYSAGRNTEFVFLMRGEKAIAEQKWSDAVEPVRMAVAIRPQSAAIQQTWGSTQIYGLHDYAGGIASYRKAISLGASYRDVALEIAHAQQMAGENDAALKTLDEAKIEHPVAHLIRGVIYLERHRVPEAAAELRTAVESDPHNLWALFEYGNALCAMGRGDEARAQWQRAREIDPGFRPAMDAACNR